MNINFKILKQGGLLLSLLLGPLVHAQWQNGLWTGKQANNWCFGYHHGITFASVTPQILVGSQTNAREGSTVLSNSEGELLFYASNATVWNKNNEAMLNGTGLLSGSDSSTQSGIIIPKPGAPGIYYLFNEAVEDGLVYSEIDMSLNNGLGDVTANKNIVLDAAAKAEKLTAVYHADKERIWLISHRAGNNEFIAYLISSLGIATTPVVSAIGHAYSTLVPKEDGSYLNDGPAGHLKVSPDGTKLAAVQEMGSVFGGAYGSGKIEVFDFDNTTGQVSNLLHLGVDFSAYAVEFSPNSKFLYVNDSQFFNSPALGTTVIKVFQYDLDAGNEAAIAASKVTVGQVSSRLSSAMQLGPDGRIYLMNTKSQNVMVAVTNPNNAGLAAGFQQNVLVMDDNDSMGMPTFNQTYLQSGIVYEKNCGGEAAFSLLRIPDVTSVSWNFGDPASGSANISDVGMHTYALAGTYTVTAQITSNGAVQTATTQVVIGSTVFGQPKDLSACAGASGTAIFDIESQTGIILNGLDEGNYEINYFSTQADALNDTNTIENTDDFTSEGQTVYVSVIDNETGCKNVLQFEVEVFALPVLPDTLVLQGCGTFNLAEAVVAVEGLSFSYYWNEQDAATASNAIQNPEKYKAQEKNDEVYVRAENSNGCAVVNKIALTVGNCDIPKGISPNGDDYNEAFDLSNFEVEKIRIYNRYGNEVYTMKNYTNEWYGQADDKKELPTGVYYYFLDLKEGNSKTGWVYINREVN
ncbi:T9SS type B sorting domain-containing protein [Flavobacterium hauense]